VKQIQTGNAPIAHPPTAHQTRLGPPQGDHHAQGTLRGQGLEASRRRIDPV